jgi:hypothetical protein
VHGLRAAMIALARWSSSELIATIAE